MSTLSKPVALSEFSASFDLPYTPSWFDRLLKWLDRLPGPARAYIAALFLVQWLYANALLWFNEKLPPGTLELGRVDISNSRAFN